MNAGGTSMRTRVFPLILGCVFATVLVLDTAAVWARAGSGGSRGSRSYSTPSSPSSSPSSPSRVTPPPASSPAPMAQPQRPGFFGGLMGGIAGFALGGLLGSMLFGSGMGGGFGLLELLLVGGAVFFLFRMLRGRSQPEPAYAGADGRSASSAAGQGWSSGGGATMEAPAGVSDLDRGIQHIRSVDASFDPDGLVEFAKAAFVDIQDGIARRDLTAVQDRLTPQEYARLQAQGDQLKSSRRTNRIERIRIGRAQLTEAWQESGQDWGTVYFAVSLVDYTVDDSTGSVVEGSSTPVEVEEYWTFTRPVGPKPWRLSAIQTA